MNERIKAYEITPAIVARYAVRMLKERSATGREVRCTLVNDPNGYKEISCVKFKIGDVKSYIDDYFEYALPYIRRLQDHIRFIETCYLLQPNKYGLSAVANYDGVCCRVTRVYESGDDLEYFIIEVAHNELG